MSAGSASRIAVYHAGSVDDEEKALSALRAWGSQQMIQLRAALVPSIEAST
ncbi:hypothetical protein [Sorangium sp. So ce394]|uniref:hypothetical protein n=1 Tax=Sorangium sp. So ce394 TaxID=3133310 RepID=UPI003F5B41E7